jgi:hypothetical protein
MAINPYTGFKKSELTAGQLKSILSYCSKTGVFIRKTRSAKGVQIGDIAGGNSSNGYVYISIHGMNYPAHRLAWLYIHGEWPSNVIDHIDGNRKNNAIKNLRDVPHITNCQNIHKAKPSSKTGLIGSSWCKVTNKFKAQIRINGTNKYIGLFGTAEEAHAAYLSVKRQLHAGCTI